jgi:hypothetical protein
MQRTFLFCPVAKCVAYYIYFPFFLSVITEPAKDGGG